MCEIMSVAEVNRVKEYAALKLRAIKKPDDYFPLLFESEVKDYLMRKRINKEGDVNMDRMEPKEPKILMQCPHCGEGIVEDEDYVEFQGSYFHDDCFADVAPAILFNEFGAVRGIAGRDCVCVK